MPVRGTAFSNLLRRLAGVGCLRRGDLIFDADGREFMEARRREGVNPEEKVLSVISGPGSEKRTFFLACRGVDGGVSMPRPDVLAF